VGNIYAYAACWTPDAAHILYADGRAIMIANKDGTEPKELARVPGVVRGLRFSPDGHKVRFYVVSGPEHDLSSLWEMNATGKDPHLLLPEWKEAPYQCCGNWSADGKYYYFQAGHDSDQAIWVLPERRYSLGQAEPRPSRLISGPLHFTSPVPVNDGKKLLVMGHEPRVELLRYDRSNHRFDSYLQGISAGPFDFSPDRKWITYVSYPDMNLWRSRVDGSDKTQLTFPPVRAYGPRWSPNGSRIAFMDVRHYHPWRVSVVPSSGGRPQAIPLAVTSEVQEDPTWTPDGETIVFARSKQNDSERMEICRMDLKSGKATVMPDSDGLRSPRVSPDGRYIAALTNSQTEMMVFDTRTNRWSGLLKENFLGYNFWSHDGRYVYVREMSGGVPRLGRVRVADRVLEPVLSLKGLPQVVDIFTAWIGLTPDDAPVVIRDRSVQEIYALDLR
jgi:Tol biopolymer transport system component